MTGVDNLELAVPGGPPLSPQGASGMSRRRGLFDRAILAQAAIDALKKFDPRVRVRNPVMFVVSPWHGRDLSRVDRSPQPVRLAHYHLARAHRILWELRRSGRRESGKGSS